MRIVLTTEQIQSKVAELAARLDEVYQGSPDLILVGVLRGSVYFLADLSRTMATSHRLDFMEYVSYEGTRKGVGNVLKGCTSPVADADIVLVDEIVETGETLEKLRGAILHGRPRSLAACVLIRKEGVDRHPPPEYVGFSMGPEFLIGYGLDHQQQYRHLPYIATL